MTVQAMLVKSREWLCVRTAVACAWWRSDEDSKRLAVRIQPPR